MPQAHSILRCMHRVAPAVAAAGTPRSGPSTRKTGLSTRYRPICSLPCAVAGMRSRMVLDAVGACARAQAQQPPFTSPSLLAITLKVPRYPLESCTCSITFQVLVLRLLFCAACGPALLGNVHGPALWQLPALPPPDLGHHTIASTRDDIAYVIMRTYV